jgi:hypothetical protein
MGMRTITAFMGAGDPRRIMIGTLVIGLSMAHEYPMLTRRDSEARPQIPLDLDELRRSLATVPFWSIHLAATGPERGHRTEWCDRCGRQCT